MTHGKDRWLPRPGRAATAAGGGVAGFARVALLLLIIGAVAAAGIGFEVKRRFTAEGPLTQAEILWVERGNGLGTVTSKLADMRAVRDPQLFTLAARMDGVAAGLKAGEYEIPAGASIADIIGILKEAKPILRVVTVPEGRTTAQVIRMLSETELLTGEVTLEPAEGSLLPETYSYSRGEARDELITRMQAAHREAVDSLWETRAADLPIKTKEEAVVLASIVEKETGVADERPRVAGVFINRLRRGMKLQSDPTVIYGVSRGEPLGRGIYASELRAETPYNTYIIRGLPPTPIANPGREAIAAVLNPLQTDELYFVADGTGGHAFATTLAEHSRNVAKWRQIERAQSQGN